MGDLHDEIVGILAKLCRNCKRESGKLFYEDVYADHITGFEKKPLIITLSRRGGSLIENYHPDVWAEYPRGGIDIFEVWHSELQSDAINDIILSALVKGVKFLHIICTEYRITADKAHSLVNLLLNKLYNKKGNHLLSPQNVYFASLPKEIHKDRVEVEKCLTEKLKL